MCRTIFHCGIALPRTLLSQAVFLFIVVGVTAACGRTPTTTHGSTIELKFEELRAATKIVLMIVPYPASFRSHVSKSRLPNVACAYEVYSGRGPVFDEVIEIIRRSGISPDDEPNRSADLRVGIVFKNGVISIQEFYFDDWGGAHDVRGVSGDLPVAASADLPSQLRALLTHPDVLLINGQPYFCPHS